MTQKFKLKGILRVPGDKSISHRALIFAVLSKGISKIGGLSPAVDCVSTMECLKQLGLGSEKKRPESNGNRAETIIINSPGLTGLSKPDTPLFCGNSGTTMRLISGLIAGQLFNGETIFDGDDSLRTRPMNRVLAKLCDMGASIKYFNVTNHVPFAITGGNLQGREFTCDIASAQVQTAVLLAGLQANGITTIAMPTGARDHTKRMFLHIGVPCESLVDSHTSKISVKRLSSPIEPYEIEIPADISSAAFFMVAAACLPGSELLLNDLTLNPGRILVIKILQEMGAALEIINKREICCEPVGDILIKGVERLRGATISGAQLASGVDEVPILALAGALCDGVFTVKDAGELKIKESDRLNVTVDNLQACGAKVEKIENGFVITGQQRLAGGSLWRTFDDHRMAMTGMIANLLAENPVIVDNDACIVISYPGFMTDLEKIASLS